MIDRRTVAERRRARIEVLEELLRYLRWHHAKAEDVINDYERELERHKRHEAELAAEIARSL